MEKLLLIASMLMIALTGCNRYNRILEEVYDKDQASRMLMIFY
jgi:outer membrane lipoprotein SlyB